MCGPTTPSTWSRPERAVWFRAIHDVAQTGIWINGGYFVFRNSIFDYVRPGDELVEEPFRRLIAEDQLLAYPYEGFWAPTDTLKDRERLEALVGATAGLERLGRRTGDGRRGLTRAPTRTRGAAR